MAVEFVQAVTATNDAGGDDDIGITVGSGSDRCLALFIAHRGSTTGYSASSNVDGALTVKGTVSSQADAFGRAVTALYLLNPTTGAHTVTISASSGQAHGIYGLLELTGVDQTTPTGTAVSDDGTSGTSSSVAATTADDDDLIVDGFALRGNSVPTAGADQTARTSEEINPGINVYGATSTQPGNISGDVMSWSHINAQRALLAVPYKAASAVSLPIVRGLETGVDHGVTAAARLNGALVA